MSKYSILLSREQKNTTYFFVHFEKFSSNSLHSVLKALINTTGHIINLLNIFINNQ